MVLFIRGAGPIQLLTPVLYHGLEDQTGGLRGGHGVLRHLLRSIHDGEDDKHDQRQAEQDDLHAADDHGVVPPGCRTSYEKGTGIENPSLLPLRPLDQTPLGVLSDPPCRAPETRTSQARG